MAEEPNGASEEKEEKITEEQPTECEKRCREYLDGWKRARADLINYQKEETERLEEVIKFSNWDLIKESITVLDSFAALERNIKDAAEGERDLAGVEMIQKQLEDVLRKRGLERIMISAGQPFDPAFHEAVGETESEQPAGAVAEEIERGYILNGRVIRPSRVKLSKGHNVKS